jgi:ribosomal protein S18 acetylase RimI-like enzyme
MNNKFEIRPTTPEDTQLLLSFIKELAEYEKLAHEVTATEALLQESLFGPHAHAEALIGYLDDKPVAFAIFFQNFSTFVGKSGVYLEDLYVKPECRGLGLGKKMLLHVVEIAKSRKCGRVEWSVLDWNTPAIEFYKSLGAKAMDEWTVYRLKI